MSDLKKMLQSVWLTAHIKGELTLPFEDRKQAHRYRFMLYEAVAETKRTKYPQKLFEAVSSCELTWVDDKTLRIALKTEKEVLSMIAGVIGEDFKNICDEILAPQSTETPLAAKTAEESLAILMNKLAADSDPQQEPNVEEPEQEKPRSTPYYSRDPGRKL
jgi:hypothetical protein